MKQLTLETLARRPGVMLVPVDQQFSLIDRVGERVFIMNAAAAWVWTRLGTDEAVAAEYKPAVTAFADELTQLELADVSAENVAVPFAGRLGEMPRFEAQSALQVAANNSAQMANPFLL